MSGDRRKVGLFLGTSIPGLLATWLFERLFSSAEMFASHSSSRGLGYLFGIRPSAYYLFGLYLGLVVLCGRLWFVRDTNKWTRQKAVVLWLLIFVVLGSLTMFVKDALLLLSALAVFPSSACDDEAPSIAGVNSPHSRRSFAGSRLNI